MNGMNEIAKWLMIAGVATFAVGLLMWFGARLPFFGHLPGDIRIERDGFTLFAPIASMIVVSLVLTVLLNVIARLLR